MFSLRESNDAASALLGLDAVDDDRWGESNDAASALLGLDAVDDDRWGD
jgi:hypothetical protein